MKNVTLRQLRVFASVAKHLSFIRAAEELKLTAPAVSMQIKELEAEVGLPLFDRTSRQVSLTTVGEYMLAHTQRVLSAMRDASDLVAQFREEHPGIEIRLQVANNRDQIVTLMQQGDIELAIMGRPPQGWPTRAEPFAMHPHVLVTSIDHPFTRMESVPASALAEEGFIVREPKSGTRAALDEYMRSHHMTARVAMQMSSNEAIKQAVMAGMGIALLSLHTLGLELNDQLIAAPHTEGLPVMRRWHVVHNLAKTLSPAAAAFRYFILERGEAFLAKYFQTETETRLASLSR